MSTYFFLDAAPPSARARRYNSLAMPGYTLVLVVLVLASWLRLIQLDD